MRNIRLLLVFILPLFLIVACSTNSTTTYQLTLTVDPSEGGRVIPQSGEYQEGEAVEITATANEDWVFDGWQGDHTGSKNPATITMSSDKSVTAQFNRLYALTVNIEGEGDVSERVIQNKTTEYAEGSLVELTAMPEAGWEFIEWQGDLSSTNNPESISINEETNVTAVFDVGSYGINAVVEGEGEIVITPVKEEYSYGEEVTITVNPNEGWNFVHWDGDAEGTEMVLDIIIEHDLSIVAVLDQSPFAGGNGSKMYPYQVSTLDQLQAIRNYTDDPTINFVQINDIDASSTINWNSGQGFLPIGSGLNNSDYFSGTYDGQSHEISNLFISSNLSINKGFFGATKKAKISNIFIHNSTIETARQAGLLIGVMNEGSVHDVHVSGSLSGENLGGLVGYNDRGVISMSSAQNVSIIGESGRFFGGLIGINNGGEVRESFSNVVIDANTADRVGGLIGSLQQGIVVNSYSTGRITGRYNVGGLIGSAFLVGSFDSEISGNYSTVEVNANGEEGGLIGIGDIPNESEINSNYWDVEVSKQINGISNEDLSGLVGLKTSQMQGSDAQENMTEFDWVNIWNITDGFPILRWQQEE